MEIIKREQAAEFDAFVKSHYKASFMQGSPWAGVKKNWQWRGVISRGEDGKIDGTMALLIRKVPGMPYSLMYSPRGPVCDPHDRAMVKKLVDAAVEVGKEFNAYVLTMDTDIKVEDTEFANLVKSLGFTVDPPHRALKPFSRVLFSALMWRAKQRMRCSALLLPSIAIISGWLRKRALK